MQLQMNLTKKFGKQSMPSAADEIGITWTMIPPRAPHFGGLWESSVKLAKSHLRRVMGNNVLTYEELSTLLCDIEAILNSRPLLPISTEVLDVRTLTPAMTVKGKEMQYLPLPVPPLTTSTLQSFETHPAKRWAHMQKLIGIFWKRWSKEYLSSLQPRKKWTSKQRNFEVGDVALLMDENQPPLQWPLARVVEVYLGRDNQCRSAKVRTAKGCYVRPCIKLRKLPVSVE